jgi:hypothetical protein
VFCQTLLTADRKPGMVALHRAYALVREHGAVLPRHDDSGTTAPFQTNAENWVACACAPCIDAGRLREFNSTAAIASVGHLFSCAAPTPFPASSDVCGVCGAGWSRVDGVAYDCVPYLSESRRQAHARLVGPFDAPPGFSASSMCVHHRCWSARTRAHVLPCSRSNANTNASSSASQMSDDATEALLRQVTEAFATH